MRILKYKILSLVVCLTTGVSELRAEKPDLGELSQKVSALENSPEKLWRFFGLPMNSGVDAYETAYSRFEEALLKELVFIALNAFLPLRSIF